MNLFDRLLSENFSGIKQRFPFNYIYAVLLRQNFIYGEM